jgi:hypothetical protein
VSQLPVGVRLAPTRCTADDVIHVQPVVGLKRASTVAAFPRLPLQPRRYARGDARRLPPSCAPLPLVAVVGAASSLHCDVPTNRPLRVARSALPPAARRAVYARPFLSPGLPIAPVPGRVRMANPAPRSQLWAHPCGHVLERLCATDRGEVVAPSANDRGEGLDPPCLPSRARSSDDFYDLPLVGLYGRPARFDERLVAALDFRRVLPHVASQTVKPGDTRVDGPWGRHPGCARRPCQSHPAQGFRTQRLRLLEHFPVWV